MLSLLLKLFMCDIVSNLPWLAGCSNFWGYCTPDKLYFVRVKPANHGRFRYYKMFMVQLSTYQHCYGLNPQSMYHFWMCDLQN